MGRQRICPHREPGGDPLGDPDHHVVAAVAQAFANEFLGLAHTVHVGGVELCDAARELAAV